VVQLANVVLLWLIGLGLGLSVPFAYYGVVMPLVALLTLLPLSINGMGLRELGTVVLLAPLGVAAEQSATLAFLQFAAFSATSLLGGVFYLAGGYPSPDDKVTRWQGDKVTEEAAGGSVTLSPCHPVTLSSEGEGPDDAEPVRGGADQGRARQPPAAA